MRFGLFYEHQLPRPWDADAEANLLANALEQVELADRLGFHSVWEVEHHFLEEYSHSSAPEVFLAAASQRTQRIRLGHGIVQLPPPVNHPARVAERIATLDLVSGGRVEFGTGEGSSQVELGAFGVSRDDKRAQWEEALDAVTRMFVEEPFAGYDGQWIRMPPRNILPKPKQKPHPPLWVACSRRETILLAARNGLGALSFSFIEPEQAKEWVDEYYRILASEECVPAGFSVNPNLAVVVPFMCHQDEETAIQRGIDGAHFFGYSLAHYYVFGQHRPGRTNVWDEFQEHRNEYGFAREIVRPEDVPLGVTLLQQGLGSLRGAIGTPEQITELIARYERAGVDQVIFVGQAGRNRHEHICESIELFGKEVLPRFAERADEVDAARLDRLAGAMEQALARRSPPRRAEAEYMIGPQAEPRAAPPPGDVRAAHGPVVMRQQDRPRTDLGWFVDVTGFERTRARVTTLLQQRGEASFASFIKKRTDAQLDRLMGTNTGLRVIFGGMERAFRPEKTQGFTGDIQYELQAARGIRRWVIRIGEGRKGIRTGPGRSPAPAVMVRMSVHTFARIISGELSAPLAFMDGRIQLEGNFEVAARMGEWFGQTTAF
jgi:alkanesulfonate monooxygenase SsuD/methylene tetrahydromethanopterin reductase-like flavin-dependent oxidoreductase (luciferase family)/putative sterol carrier protein